MTKQIAIDKWLYPEDLNGADLIIHICYDDEEETANFYPLPKNWREVVTKNKGKDGKQSIHDLI